VEDGFPQVRHIPHPPLAPPLLVGHVEVQEHHNPRFGVQPREGDDPHPDGDAQVVVQQVQEPEGTDQRKRNGQDDDERLHDRLGVHVEEDQDDEQGQGDDHPEPLLGLHHVFVFAAPDEAVAFGDLERRDGLFRFPDVAADVAPGKIDVDVGSQESLFALDRRGAPHDPDIRQFPQGNPGRGRQGGRCGGT
jgi:hypothetical protein